jgi:hypothetical protein
MRYNIFNQVHRPFKLALLHTCIELSKDDSATTSWSQVICNVKEVISLYKHQVKFEYSYLLPLVFEYEPSVWDIYTIEHQQATNILRGIENLVQLMEASGDQHLKRSIMNEIKSTYNEFMRFNFQHMEDEEEVLNEILWRYYNDNFLLQIVHHMYEPAGIVSNKSGNLYQQAAA